jgi:drug/metabolite transporter (DMT)-like permease
MWGVLLLGEEVTWLRLAAMLVIFAGIAFATTRTGVVRQEMR